MADFNEEKKREYIELMNEKERQRLLEEVAALDEQEKKAEKKKPFLSQIKGQLGSFIGAGRGLFGGAKTDEPVITYTGSDIENPEPAFSPIKEKTVNTFEKKVSSLSKKDRFIIYLVHAENLTDFLRMPFITAGKDFFGDEFTEIEKGYGGIIIFDEFKNENGIERDITMPLVLAMKRAGIGNISHAFAISEGRDGLTTFAEAEKKLKKEHYKKAEAKIEETVSKEEHKNEHFSEDVLEALKANAIEQARREFARQLEEDGEIDPDEVTIKNAEDMSLEEYESYLPDSLMKIKEDARNKRIDDDVFIKQVLHNINKHNTITDPLYVIAIADKGLNTLVILDDLAEFEVLCEGEGLEMISCSYIFAVSKSGGHWYGSYHATPEIENMFNIMSDLVRENHGSFKEDMLFKIPNISMFKDVYIQ